MSDGERSDEPLQAGFHACPTSPDCPYCGDGVLPTARSRLDWSFLDGVYCISLQSREDRAETVTSELHRVGLCRHTVFFRPIKHHQSPKIGVWESHQTVLRDALKRGQKRVLVLEDDVVFNRAMSAATTTAIRKSLQRLPADWNAFYLGHWVLWMSPRGSRVMRSGSLCTHAYIASTRLMHWLDEHPFNKRLPRFKIAGKGIDAVFAVLPGMYSLFPMVATQSDSPSDHMKAKRHRSKFNDIISNSRWREQLLSGLMRPNEVVVFLLTPVILPVRYVYGLVKHLGRGGEK